MNTFSPSTILDIQFDFSYLIINNACAIEDVLKFVLCTISTDDDKLENTNRAICICIYIYCSLRRRNNSFSSRDDKHRPSNYNIRLSIVFRFINIHPVWTGIIRPLAARSWPVLTSAAGQHARDPCAHEESNGQSWKFEMFSFPSATIRGTCCVMRARRKSDYDIH